MARKKKNGKKEDKLRLKREILRVLACSSKGGMNYKEIGAQLNISDTKGRNDLIKSLYELKAKGEVSEVTRGKYTSNTNLASYQGEIQINLQGNGYVVVPELERDVFVPYARLNTALNGDTVEVAVLKAKRSGVLEGEIVTVRHRRRTAFVGIVDKYAEFAFVKPKDPKVYKDIYVSINDIGNANNGDSVLVELVRWDNKRDSPEGKIVQVFGKPGDHGTEIHAILAEYGLPAEFEPEVAREADNLNVKIEEAEIALRRDMRDVLTFTIDPRDAKDFDDALSFVALDDEWYEIGVHIADVSHYVREGSLLDDSAFERGTSVYLVDRVVPMLPEVLSNVACSLRPNEDKLTFSIVFIINGDGQVKDQWIGRTVIHSNQRFCYEEAQWIIEHRNKAIPSDISLTMQDYVPKEEFVDAILRMDVMAKQLRRKRMNAGAISFDKIEVKFNLDEQDEPVGVYFKESKDANKLIEEFMLLANKRVAEFVGKGKPEKTFVYRIHDQPDEDKLYALNGIVNRFGHALDFKSKRALNSSLNKLLADVKGKREQNLVDTLAIRSMSKASYATQNIGHYGLAFDYYTHFTSPIRRYPDIMVHRLLARYLDKGKSVNAESFEEKCKHASDMEVLASSAERDSIKYMQVRFMEKRKNIPFKGVISGVTEWGIYVELLENKCEGMIRIRDLIGDFFTYNEREYALIGERTGKKYQLGDDVVVEVKHTDVLKRHLDFNLVVDKAATRKFNFV